MGFCRRCGEIVFSHAARCKCGGTAVAPSMPWSESSNSPSDKWTKTYVSHVGDSASPASIPEQLTAKNNVKSNPTKVDHRFPRPMSTPGFSRIDGNRITGEITEDIASFTRTRTPSPSKGCLETVTESPPVDLLNSPHKATLAKAYGSILQPPETLPIHTCAICSIIFPPDATIYPDLMSIGSVQFLCRHCFAENGGSKGPCATCGRDVLVADKEGPFIENSGRVWHKRCFLCNNCNKDMGHAPMVDLFNKPSCPECFNTCTKREGTLEKKNSELTDNIGRMKGSNQQNNFVFKELSERLGIAHKQDSARSPQFSSMHSLQRDQEILSREQMDGSAISSPRTLAGIKEQSVDSPPLTMTSPSQCHAPECIFKMKEISTTLKTMKDTRCQGCTLPLFNNGGAGRVVTIPNVKFTDTVDSYHASCFECVVCGESFKSNDHGQAIFVREDRGVCHPECAADPVPFHYRSTAHKPLVFDDIPHHPSKSAPPLSKGFLRFGRREVCPGCKKVVSPMEPGVVSGPQGTRWHASCLVCGGKGSKLPRPGCGKRLDSAAKADINGDVWCRECMLLLPRSMSASPQASPTRRLTPSFTGTGLTRASHSENRIFAQMTGNGATNLPARQYTEGAMGLLRSESVSPTRRNVSPTKELMKITRHSRPMGSWRRNKSVDEGRGMFLVRQMTGNGLS